MHMLHLSWNTSVVSKSLSDWLNYTGFPGDMCVAFFNVPPGNKDAVVPNSLTKEESRRVYKCDGDQNRLNAGFSKVCEIFKVCTMETIKYIREIHTPVCYCGNISTPWNVTLNETNCDWLSVKRPHERALNNEYSHIFPDLQPSVWRSCYARLEGHQCQIWYKCFLFSPSSLSVPVCLETLENLDWEYHALVWVSITLYKKRYFHMLYVFGAVSQQTEAETVFAELVSV